MSLRVIELCRSRKFRTHTIKHVIKEMADRASDDGTGIYCSKQTLANDTGLSKTSVKKHTQELLESGLIVETGKYWREGRYTKVYRIVLERVHELEKKPERMKAKKLTPTEVAINTPPKKLGKPVLGTSATPQTVL